MCKVKDEEGQLPLHVALEHYCCDDVIDLLLRKHPKAVVVEDSANLTPLHLAVVRGCTARVLNLLLIEKDGLKALWKKDIDGCNPLHMWFTELCVSENYQRKDRQQENHFLLSDEELFEIILGKTGKLTFDQARNLIGTVNEKKENMLVAAKNIQTLVPYPPIIVERMEEIFTVMVIEIDDSD